MCERVLLQILWRRAFKAEKQHTQQPGGRMAWEEWSMWGGDAAAEVGRGRVAKDLECREEPGSQGGVLHEGGHGGV